MMFKSPTQQMEAAPPKAAIAPMARAMDSPDSPTDPFTTEPPVVFSPITETTDVSTDSTVSSNGRPGTSRKRRYEEINDEEDDSNNFYVHRLLGRIDQLERQLTMASEKEARSQRFLDHYEETTKYWINVDKKSERRYKELNEERDAIAKQLKVSTKKGEEWQLQAKRRYEKYNTVLVKWSYEKQESRKLKERNDALVKELSEANQQVYHHIRCTKNLEERMNEHKANEARIAEALKELRQKNDEMTRELMEAKAKTKDDAILIARFSEKFTTWSKTMADLKTNARLDREKAEKQLQQVREEKKVLGHGWESQIQRLNEMHKEKEDLEKQLTVSAEEKQWQCDEIKQLVWETNHQRSVLEASNEDVQWMRTSIAKMEQMIADKEEQYNKLLHASTTERKEMLARNDQMFDELRSKTTKWIDIVEVPPTSVPSSLSLLRKPNRERRSHSSSLITSEQRTTNSRNVSTCRKSSMTHSDDLGTS